LRLDPAAFLVAKHEHFLALLLNVGHELADDREAAGREHVVLLRLQHVHECPQLERQIVEEVVNLLGQRHPLPLEPRLGVDSIEVSDCLDGGEQLHYGLVEKGAQQVTFSQQNALVVASFLFGLLDFVQVLGYEIDDQVGLVCRRVPLNEAVHSRYFYRQPRKGALSRVSGLIGAKGAYARYLFHSSSFETDHVFFDLSSEVVVQVFENGVDLVLLSALAL